MNAYELLYIIPATINNDELKKAQAQVTAIMEKQNVEIVHHGIWAQRKLAYPISKVENGVYVLCYFTGDASAAAAIKQGLPLLRAVIRFALIKLDHLTPHINRFVKGEKPEEARKIQPPVSAQQPSPKTSPEEIGEKLPKAVAKALETQKEHDVEEKQIASDVSVSDTEETQEKKAKRLADLNKKLDDILEGEIEL